MDTRPLPRARRLSRARASDPVAGSIARGPSARDRAPARAPRRATHESAGRPRVRPPVGPTGTARASFGRTIAPAGVGGDERVELGKELRMAAEREVGID